MILDQNRSSVDEHECTFGIKRENTYVNMPVKGTYGSACWDIHAYLPEGKEITIYNDVQSSPSVIHVRDNVLQLAHSSRVLIPTGLYPEIPYGWSMKIYPRSGISIKKGINLVNGVAVIDSDYRGEIMVLMINLGPKNVIRNGERIAQFEITTVEPFVMKEIESLSETKRGSGGMGSTGQ